jgi:sulfite exporter TauE/SafE
MVGFGFGTLPAMWSLVFFAHFITADLRRGLRKLFPFVYILTGIILIWRRFHHHDPVQQIQKNPQSVCQ